MISTVLVLTTVSYVGWLTAGKLRFICLIITGITVCLHAKTSGLAGIGVIEGGVGAYARL